MSYGSDHYGVDSFFNIIAGAAIIATGGASILFRMARAGRRGKAFGTYGAAYGVRRGDFTTAGAARYWARQRKYAARRRLRERQRRLRERQRRDRNEARRIYQQELRHECPTRRGRLSGDLRRSIRVRVSQNGRTVRLRERMNFYGYILNGPMTYGRLVRNRDRVRRHWRHKYWIAKARERTAVRLARRGIITNL